MAGSSAAFAGTGKTRKTERIDARVSGQVKRTLEHAASMSGRSLTDFVVESALAAAQATIERAGHMRLSEEDRRIFFEALETPPEPNDALKAAAERYGRAGALSKTR